MIDAHVHVVRPNLPGVGTLGPPIEQGPAAVAAALRRDMAAAGITSALAMGCCGGEDDPLGVAGTLAVAASVPGLHAVGVADPRRCDPPFMKTVETVVQTGRVVALKAYLGYLHFPPDDPGYRPYYEIAERYKIPVIFHTGDTYSPYAKLRFARPLLVDDVAVDHPKVNFVLAHLGNPWMMDAAEVVYKNMNVWADLSGLVTGAAGDWAAEEHQEAWHDVQAEVRRAFRYAERPNRFLFGSDWPLTPIPAYRQFIAGAVPDVFQSQVFGDNAHVLFRV